MKASNDDQEERDAYFDKIRQANSGSAGKRS